MNLQEEQTYYIDTNLTQDKVITSCSDMKIRIYDVKETGLVFINELVAHEAPVTCAIFLGESNMIASVDDKSNLILWKIENGKYIKKLNIKIFSGSTSALSYSGEKEINIYAGCSDGRIRKIILDNTLGYKIEEYYAHNYGVCVISSNNKFIVSGGNDNKIVLWDNKMNKIEEFIDHDNYIRAAVLAPENDFDILCFASCGEDKKCIIYTKEGEEKIKKQIIELDKECYTLAWSKCGFALTVGYGENEVKTFMPNNDGEFKSVDMEKVN
ncbi:SEC13 protein [Spraguea lophii 42_110]|uniref:SEC13 protein n=1 Tax=Spraguea lophii (strain 42_110) TaxID=1358809 RepID=S7WCA6_SPRLO|nr:SEC13 protein [Spraguea lophii 42_110]